ncbi:RNF26 ligase, partial [Dyaphorophyia castanea]|nr:RNF26 ligase [Platysteira castanea]
LRLLRDLLRDLLLPVLDLNFALCCWLGSALLWLLLAAAGACGDALALVLGCCAATEGLGVGTRLLMDLGRACLAGTRRLFTLLAALWDSLARSNLGVSELLATFLARVSGRATAVSIQLWPHCQLAFKLLCSATVVFISIYFLLYSLAVVCHSGAQSLSTLFVPLWDSLTGLIFGVTGLLAAFLAHVSSGAIAVSMLLWWPCQMAFELLCSVTKVFISICFLVYSLVKGLLSLCLMGSRVIYCNRELLWVLKGRVLGYSRRLQPVLWQLCQVALLSLRRAMASQHWRRLVDWVLRVTQGRGQLGAGQVPEPWPALSHAAAGQRHQTLGEEPGTSGRRAVRRQQLNATAEETSGNNLWALLNEQEERKKCVICQDQTKTVLLLPCRHLCLCQECTEVLLQQDIYQRNCPLCRQMILQTLNVYL